MSVLDIAGEQLEGSSSEETHRRGSEMKRRDARAAPSFGASYLAIFRRIGARRTRIRAAGGLALLMVIALVWLLPKQDVHIAVDGGMLTVSSRSQSAQGVADQAGIELAQGDRLERIDGNDFVVHRAVEATVNVDGATYMLRTQAGSIDELLRKSGVRYSAEDSIYRNGVLAQSNTSVLEPAELAVRSNAAGGLGAPSRERVAIEVRRAVPFTIIENGQELQLTSSRTTLASALSAVGVRVGPGDAVLPGLSTEMTPGLEVHIDHARPLVVTMPEGKVMLYTLASTVGEALTTGAIPLPPEYRLEPNAEAEIGAGLAVHVIGVSAEQVNETERIESHTIYEPDTDLAYGQQRIVEGHDGVLHRAYQINYEDGQQVGRKVASEWYDPEPADTIIYYSTATEPAQAPPVSAAYVDGLSDLVCSYDWDCDWALAVIQCESGGNANAYNAGGYVGLFQIWQGHGPNLTDPATNIAAAYSLYSSGGAGNWPNCP